MQDFDQFFWDTVQQVGGYWGFAPDLVPKGYWTPGSNQTSDNYWAFPERADLFDPNTMIMSEFAASSLEDVEDLGAEAQFQAGQFLQTARTYAMGQLPGGTMRIQLGATDAVEIYIPEEARSLVKAMGKQLAEQMAEKAEEVWGRMLSSNTDIDEFVWWPELADSTKKAKEAMGLSPERAAQPNYRTGDTARKMIAHAFGKPEVTETDNGLVTQFGPKPGQFESHEDMKYREMFGGTGPGTPNPASGRGHRTIRPARPFGFVEELRLPFQSIITDWIGDINRLVAEKFPGAQQIDATSIKWTI